MMQAVRTGISLWLWATLVVACRGAPSSSGQDEPADGGDEATDEADDEPLGGAGGSRAGGRGGAPAQVGGAGGNPTPSPRADAGADAGASPPPSDAGADLVPMFVASGYAGRTVTSCDDGRTWIANHQLAGADDDHSPYTGKGLAYGQGTFLVMMGWGADGSVKISDDGITWRRETNLQKTFYGGIGFGGGVFATLRQNAVQLSTDQGKTWVRAKVQPGGDFREAGGGSEAEGVFGGGGSAGRPWMSWDGGNSWREASGCNGIDLGGIGQRGGVAYHDGTLVFVGGNGNVCAVTNRGASFANASIGAVNGKLFVAGGAFWVPNGDRAKISNDGLSWRNQTFAPAGTSFHAVARGASGTFVGVAREGRFYRSTDGASWERATGPAGGPTLLRVVAGYGKRSGMCP